MSDGSEVFAMLLGMGLVWGEDQRELDLMKARVCTAEAKASTYLQAANLSLSNVPKAPVSGTNHHASEQTVSIESQPGFVAPNSAPTNISVPVS